MVAQKLQGDGAEERCAVSAAQDVCAQLRAQLHRLAGGSAVRQLGRSWREASKQLIADRFTSWQL